MTKITLGIAVVKVANPYTHIYGIEPITTWEGMPLITAMAIGSRGNSPYGVQTQQAYSVGDTVLFAYQDWESYGSVTIFGYILGVVPLNTQVITDSSDIVDAALIEGNSLNYSVCKAFETLEQNAMLSTSPLRNNGHGLADMLPGDSEASGELVTLYNSDYISGLFTNGAKLMVSGIDRRIISRSLLKTESTICGNSDLAIVGRSVINTRQFVGNIDQAFYNQIEETKDGVKIRENAPKPIYRSFEIAGDAVYGRQHALLSHDGQSVLYRDFEANNGTKTVFSATGLRIGRASGIGMIEYTGGRLNDKTYDPSPDETAIAFPVPGIVSGDDWGLIGNPQLLGADNYPNTFVPEDKYGYDDLAKIDIDDPQQPNGKISVAKGKSDIFFRDDGSILLTDAWGSYILLSHGNIELHARNNLFTVASRDHLSFSGGTHVTFAERNIEEQALSGSVKINAGDRLALQSDKGTVIESKTGLNLIGKTIAADGLNITVTCRDTDKPGMVAGGGSFKLLVPDGDVAVSSKSGVVYADAINVVTDTAAVGIGSNISVYGDTFIHGGLATTRHSAKCKVINPATGAVEQKNITGGVGTSITNTIGDIRAEGFVTSNKGVAAKGLIAGTQVCAQSQGDDGRVKKCHNVEQQTKIQIPKETDNNIDTVKDSAPTTLEKVSFKFDTESASCAYVLPTEPVSETNNTFKNDGTADKNNEKGYIYPGRRFWTTDGLISETTHSTDGFKTLAAARANDKKKG